MARERVLLGDVGGSAIGGVAAACAEVAVRVVEPGGMLVVEIGQRAFLQERGGAGTAMRCAVFLLLRNDIPHRGPLLEDPSGRLARDGLFCAGSARCAGRAAPIVNILAGIIKPRRPAKRHLKRRETGNSPRHGSDLLDCSSRCASIRRAGVRTPVRHHSKPRYSTFGERRCRMARHPPTWRLFCTAGATRSGADPTMPPAVSTAGAVLAWAAARFGCSGEGRNVREKAGRSERI